MYFEICLTFCDYFEFPRFSVTFNDAADNPVILKITKYYIKNIQKLISNLTCSPMSIIKYFLLLGWSRQYAHLSREEVSFWCSVKIINIKN